MSPNAARKMDFDLTHDDAGEAAELAARAINAEVDAIKADPSRLAEIDADVAFAFDGETFEMYVVLSDASDCGLINRLAEGDDANKLNACQLDVFARLARIADRMSDAREVAVRKAVAK